MFYVLCFDTSRISLYVIIGDDEMYEMQFHNRFVLVSCFLVTTIMKASVWLVKMGKEVKSIGEEGQKQKLTRKPNIYDSKELKSSFKVVLLQNEVKNSLKTQEGVRTQD